VKGGEGRRESPQGFRLSSPRHPSHDAGNLSALAFA